MNATTSLMQALAWSLLHFLWQGAAIAAVAASLMFVLRKPATRYLVGLGALALMLVSFAVTFSYVTGSATNAATEFPTVGAPAAASASTLAATAPFMAELTMEEQAANFQSGDFLWISRAWLLGVFVFALRIAFGLLVLEHLRRRNLVALPPALVVRFEALQQRLGIRRAIRYCECHLLRVPAVIGVFRPIVLLPMRALTGLSPEQLEAVIAHELGHIKRFDVAVNFFQVIAETLFFFHPAVWWLNKRIRADREDCCDDVAIAACGGTVGYARALATMESWRDAPSFAMAATGSPVTARVARLLGVRSHDTGARTAGMVTATVVLVTALVTGALSVGVALPALAQGKEDSLQQLVAQAEEAVAVQTEDAQQAREAKQAQQAQQAKQAQKAQQAKQAQQAHQAEQAKAAASAQPAPKPVPAPRPQVAPMEPRAPMAPRAPTAPPAPPAPLAPHEAPAAPASAPTVSYIEEMKTAGYDNLDVDDLIALKVQGVTPDYIREMRAAGFNPDASELIAMKVHGVDTAYVREIRSTGYNPETQELISMKVHDVSPAFVKSMRDAGFDPDAQEIITMKVHGVTPEYYRMLTAAGYEVDTQQLIHAKVMDITPDFIRKVNAHGFKNLSVEKLIQLKNAGIL
jgi:beta-lactamase regulating signal transducer with metallopeptidase domain